MDVEGGQISHSLEDSQVSPMEEDEGDEEDLSKEVEEEDKREGGSLQLSPQDKNV